MSLRANALANFGGQFFAAALVLVLAPAYIDALGLEAWGLVGILAMLSVWFNLLDVGLTPAISRELAARGQGNAAAARAAAGLVRCVEWIYLAVVISVISVVALAASSVATGGLNLSVLQAGPAGQALMLIGVVVGLRLYENIYRAVLTGLEELLVLNLLSSVFALLRWGGGLAFILTFGPPNVVDLFAWQAAVSALSLLVFAIVGHRHLRAAVGSARADFAALKRIRGFAAGIAATSALGVLLTQVDKILLSRMLPLADFGGYVLAASLVDALSLLAAPLYAALTPRFVRLYEAHDTQALAALYLQATQLLAVLLMPCALLLVVHAEGVIRAWSGDAALASRIAPLVAVLALGRMINASMQLPAALQFGAGWTSLGAKTNLVAVLFLVPLILLTVPIYGALGYAWCWVALNIGYLAVTTFVLHRRLLPQVRNRWLRDAVLLPAAMALGWMITARWLVDMPDGRLALAMVLVAVLVTGIVVVACVSPAARAFARKQLLS